MRKLKNFMIKKIKEFFNKFLYYLSFGLKSANDEMFYQNAKSETSSTSINQNINDYRLSKNLLKGEVTQEVEELRYRTYAVERESNNYVYLGNGVAVKKKDKKQFNYNNFNIIQENLYNCKSISEEFKRIGKEEYASDDFTLNIVYNTIPKYRLERYCFLFEIIKNEGVKHLKLKFYNNPSDTLSYSFINDVKYYYGKNLIDYDYNNLTLLSFITYKCIGDDELVKYEFNNLVLKEVKFVDNDRIIEFIYDFNEFNREDLTDKYYSETMDKKYKNKEKKENIFVLDNNERLEFCSECGKRINVYDSDITRENFGYPLCNECIKKLYY